MLRKAEHVDKQRYEDLAAPHAKETAENACEKAGEDEQDAVTIASVVSPERGIIAYA